jgi:hypothetical protein
VSNLPSKTPSSQQDVLPSANGRTAIAAALRLFVEPGQVVELRAIKVSRGAGRPHTEAGFYDYAHLDEMAADALNLTQHARAVYFTLNPLKPDVLARRANRVAWAEEGELTADKDITRRRWFLVDVDPDRDANVSSTDAEKALALDVADAVMLHFQPLGWPEPAITDSGNGYHLLYRVDLPSDDGGLLKRCLQALAARFDTERVHVDQKVFNPGRICKMPGTWARKGDSIAERPHRRAELLRVPEVLTPVSRDLLEALAVEAPAPQPKSQPKPAPTGGYSARLDVSRWLRDRQVGFVFGQTADGRDRWKLDHCPFNSSHTEGDAAIFQDANGKRGASCYHHSCNGNGWQQFKEKIGKPDPDHYDPPLNGPGPRTFGKGGSDTNGEAAPPSPDGEEVFPADWVFKPASQWVSLPPEQEWLWEGLVERKSFTLLSALWKCGKTTLLSHMVRSFGSGGLLLNRSVVPGRLGYVTEEAEWRWAERRDRLGYGDWVHLLRNPFRAKPRMDEWTRFLRWLTREQQRLQLDGIVIDTLDKVWPVENENDTGEVVQALMPMRPLADLVAVLALHHLRKADGQQGTGSRGSGALAAFADTILEFRRYKPDLKRDRRRALTAYSRNDDITPELIIELEAESGDYIVRDENSGGEGDERDEREEARERHQTRLIRQDGSRILVELDALAGEDEYVPRRRVRDRTRLNGDRFGKALEALLKDGTLEAEPDGKKGLRRMKWGHAR